MRRRARDAEDAADQGVAMARDEQHAPVVGLRIEKRLRGPATVTWPA